MSDIGFQDKAQEGSPSHMLVRGLPAWHEA